MSPEFSGLNQVYNFIPFNDRLKSQEYITPDESIYFSYFEKKKIKEIASLFNKNNTKEYSILGNPCSGKSTLAEAIYKNFIPHFRNRTFHLDLSSPEINGNDVLKEIGKLSFYRTILIIDNVHDNVQLFNRIHQRIANFDWVKAIYLSRYYNSFREEDQTSILNVFKNITQFRYNPNLDFEEKVSGIIDNRVYFLKKEFPEFTWYKGDFKTVLKNTDSNLLKLNIAFETWISSTKKGKNLKLDEINNDSIYSYFFDAHKLSGLNTELLFLYSYLFSHDISFLKVKGKTEEFAKLKEKGIIINYTTSDYYYFPHRDYANLIYQTLKKEKDLETEYLIELLINYLGNYKTESELNLIEIILKSSVSGQFKIVRAILKEEKVLELISKKFNGNIRIYEVFELQKIFFHSFEYLNNKTQSTYYNLFIKYYSKNKLELYISKDYSVYSNLLQIANQLNLELGDIIKTLRINEQANTNSITELTMRISKKKATPETARRILNSYHFPEWLSMIEKLPTLSRITNSLSELNTSPLSKKLLFGIINQMNIEHLVKKSKNLKTVQIGKSIRELEKIDISLGTNIAKKLLNQLPLNINTSQSNLSDFSKSLSDLSSIAPDLVNIELKNSFDNGEFYKLLEREKSISNISARILELNTTITNGKEDFYKITSEFLTSIEFKELLKNERNINSLLIFYELVKKNEIEIAQSTKNELSETAKEQILKCDFDITILSNPKLLNIPELKEKVKNEISAELLNKILISSKFTIMESLFLVLTRVDKVKTIKALNMADINILCNSMCHKELNISQSTEVLNKTKNKTFVNDNLNSNLFCGKLLDKYLTMQRTDQYQYNRLNFGGFIKAFSFSLKIDKKIALKHFEQDFLKKLKLPNNKNLSISSLFQFLRRIEEMTQSKYNNEISAFLKLNRTKFINNIKNENLEKTTSGLMELSKCDFDNYVDAFLYDTRNIISKKLREIKGNKRIEKKVYADIRILATGKSKILLNEIKASR
ncbi:MAG: hypothetical protein L3J09_04140 [Flavobacteriaceae bacterium]|nr:hypothetical protein [Flavobacteriaceae bacterium]